MFVGGMKVGNGVGANAYASAFQPLSREGSGAWRCAREESRTGLDEHKLFVRMCADEFGRHFDADRAAALDHDVVGSLNAVRGSMSLLDALRRRYAGRKEKPVICIASAGRDDDDVCGDRDGLTGAGNRAAPRIQGGGSALDVVDLRQELAVGDEGSRGELRFDEQAGEGDRDREVRSWFDQSDFCPVLQGVGD